MSLTMMCWGQTASAAKKPPHATLTLPGGVVGRGPVGAPWGVVRRGVSTPLPVDERGAGCAYVVGHWRWVGGGSVAMDGACGRGGRGVALNCARCGAREPG